MNIVTKTESLRKQNTIPAKKEAVIKIETKPVFNDEFFKDMPEGFDVEIWRNLSKNRRKKLRNITRKEKEKQLLTAD